MDEVRLVRPDSPAAWAAARRLVEEYAASLRVDLCFQDFERERESLPAMYGPPEGCLLLAEHEGSFVGCGAFHRLVEAICELKRLYVTPGMQGHGIGRALTEALIDDARRRGYRTMVLDTLPSMKPALALYAALGFRPTTAYRHNPVPGAIFLSLPLQPVEARNPWLDIPESEYVGHMSSPAVNQRAVLSRLLRDALESSRPRDVLVLGCSSGNGFEHIDAAVTRRVTGVDVNPKYLQRLRERFPNPGFALDVQCADVADYAFEPEAFDLVHAALVLEYVEWPRLVPRAAKALRPGGAFSVVLQTPSASSPAVTPTAFTSLRALEPLFHFVEPEVLVARARNAGLELNYHRTEPLPSAKAFDILRFVKQPGWTPSCRSRPAC